MLLILLVDRLNGTAVIAIHCLGLDWLQVTPLPEGY